MNSSRFLPFTCTSIFPIGWSIVNPFYPSFVQYLGAFGITFGYDDGGHRVQQVISLGSEKTSTLTNEDGFIYDPDGCLDEIIDQSSPLGTCGIYNIYLAQSFKPSLNSLSKIEIGLFKQVNASGYITVSIRERLYGEDLVTTTLSVDEVPPITEGDWVEFDFNDIEITSSKRYYIVCTLNDGTQPTEKDATVHWIMFPTDHFYFKGRAWVRGTIVPSVWHPLLLQPRSPELSFRTYGYN